MPFNLKRVPAFVLLGLAVATASQAESLASSASTAGSASVGSVSDSFRGSSNSSSHDNKTAEGDYRVVDVAVLADRPGHLRLKLQDTARAGDEGTLWLDLPQQAMAQRPVAEGDLVSARQRPYGLEFAHADTRQAFFLVLADDWYRELEARPVTL